jgi:hypothetical protein
MGHARSPVDFYVGRRAIQQSGLAGSAGAGVRRPKTSGCGGRPGGRPRPRTPGGA